MFASAPIPRPVPLSPVPLGPVPLGPVPLSPVPLSPVPLANLSGQIEGMPRITRWGQLQSVRGASLTVSGFGRAAAIGDRVRVDTSNGPVPGEIVAFAGDTVTVMVEGRAEGATPGARVILAESSDLYPCNGWLGRVVNGSGQPLDGRGPLPRGDRPMKLRGTPPEAFQRRLMGERLETGIQSAVASGWACSPPRVWASPR
jgi:flagellum-specific ATP synthase